MLGVASGVGLVASGVLAPLGVVILGGLVLTVVLGGGLAVLGAAIG